MSEDERALLLLLVDTVAWGSLNRHALYDLAAKVRATPPQPAASVPCPRCDGSGYEPTKQDAVHPYSCHDCHGTGVVPAKAERKENEQ